MPKESFTYDATYKSIYEPVESGREGRKPIDLKDLNYLIAALNTELDRFKAKNPTDTATIQFKMTIISVLEELRELRTSKD